MSRTDGVSSRCGDGVGGNRPSHAAAWGELESYDGRVGGVGDWQAFLTMSSSRHAVSKSRSQRLLEDGIVEQISFCGGLDSFIRSLCLALSVCIAWNGVIWGGLGFGEVGSIFWKEIPVSKRARTIRSL